MKRPHNLWSGRITHSAGIRGEPDHVSGAKTTRPPKGGLSTIRLFAIEENLERAKGLEPSTPTLARSCSTTELHPHPRWRRTRAVNGRPMPNADRECNSPDAVQCHADNPVSGTMAANRTETTPKRALSAPPGPCSGPDAGPPAQRWAIRPFSGASSLPQPQSMDPGRPRRISPPGAVPSSGTDVPPGVCRLNFVAKAPSSG